ncbi:MAG: DUF5807 family protein [Haloferacaceae archaeon]
MNDRALAEFLNADRPDEVAFFLAEDELDDDGRLADRGIGADGGVVLVVPGDRGRRAFAAGTGTDAMTFAGEARRREGRIAPTLDGGECPDAADGGRHALRYLLAFAEERNESVGGIYAEGDVIHAYARCACGTAYSDRWVVGDRDRAGAADPPGE